MTINHRPPGEVAFVTTRRLRAALRLLFDGRTADELIAPWAGDRIDVDELRAVARQAETRYALARVTSRLPWARRDVADRPLAAGAALSGWAALVLAFRLGLKLNVAAIAEVLDTTPERVGEDLLAARRAVDAALPLPCARYRSTLGRLGDAALDPDGWLQLLSHLPHCANCQAAYEAIPALDADLTAEIDRLEEELPDMPPQRRQRAIRARFAPMVGIAAVVTVLVAGGVLVNGLLGEASEPVPLLAADTSDDYSGWLLRYDVAGHLEFFDLETGATEPLDMGRSGQWSLPMLSPSGRQLAVWSFSQNDHDGSDTFEVSDLGGTPRHLRTYEPDDIRRIPSGWLGDTRVLVTSGPRWRADESETDYAERWTRDSQLLAVDVATGTERVLLPGNIRYAIPSPDGSMVAVLLVRGPRWPGQSIELRPVRAGELGEPIWVDERRVGENVVWAPDSSRIYYGRIADKILPDNGALRRQGRTWFEQMDLVAVDRDGAFSTLVRPGPREEVQVATASPDGSLVLYQTVNVEPGGDAAWQLWRIHSDGTGVPERIPNRNNSSYWTMVWSPDGDTLLTSTASQPDRVSQGDEVAGGWIEAITWVAFGSDWEPHIALVDVSARPASIFAWLPEDAFARVDEGTPVQIVGDASEPQPVASVRDEHRVTAHSSVSHDGNFVVLHENDLGTTIIWDILRQRAKRLRAGARGGDWLASSDGMIDVVPTGSLRALSRMIFFSPGLVGEQAFINDYRRFDPAGLGNDSTRKYEAPSMSPDLTLTSFFVVEPEQNKVTLWLVGFDLPAREVMQWTFPEDPLLEPPLLAFWADEHTLLVTQPDGWERGLPTRVSFSRVKVTNGEIAIEPLIEVSRQGRDRGIVLREMELSPDGSQIAYRLRHYGALDADRRRTDTLHVMPVSDLSRTLELERGGPGDGLVWAPDSRWLVAGLRGRIALLSVDGREMEYLTPEGQRAAWPLWIGEHEVWFSLDDGNGPRIWRVRIE